MHQKNRQDSKNTKTVNIIRQHGTRGVSYKTPCKDHRRQRHARETTADCEDIKIVYSDAMLVLQRYA